MVFLAYFVNQTMRTCITVAIVAMVKKGKIDTIPLEEKFEFYTNLF